MESELSRALILAAVVLAASLVRSELGALVLLFLLYTHLPEFSTDGSSAALAQAIVAAPAFAVAAYALIRGRLSLSVDRVLAAVVIFTATVFLSALMSSDPAVGLTAFMRDLRDMLAVLLLANLITSLRLAIWTLIVGGAFVAAAAFVGALTNQELGGFAVVEQSQIVGEITGARLAGVMGESNWFAAALVPILGLAMYATQIERRRPLRIAGLTMTLLVALAILATFSRGGFVGMLALFGLVAARRKSWRARGVVAVSLGAVLLIFAPPLYGDRMQTLLELRPGGAVSDESLRDRVSLLQVGVLILAEHPVVGVGPGNYDSVYPEYMQRVDPTIRTYPTLLQHNGPLQVADETGVLGLLALAGVVLLARYGARDARRRLASAGWSSLALLVEAAEVAMDSYLITSLFTTNAYSNRYFWMLIGLLIISGRSAQALLAANEPTRRWRVGDSARFWRAVPGAIIRSYQRAAQ